MNHLLFVLSFITVFTLGLYFYGPTNLELQAISNNLNYGQILAQIK